MREHAHSPGNVCPGCLYTAAERVRVLKAIAVKDSARAERAEAEVARLNLAAELAEGGVGGEVSWLEALARIRALEAEIVQLNFLADDVRDDYREELSAYRMSAKRAEARLAEAERHLRDHGCDFYHSGKNPRDCPECSHFPPERESGRADDREYGT